MGTSSAAWHHPAMNPILLIIILLLLSGLRRWERRPDPADRRGDLPHWRISLEELSGGTGQRLACAVLPEHWPHGRRYSRNGGERSRAEVPAQRPIPVQLPAAVEMDASGRNRFGEEPGRAARTTMSEMGMSGMGPLGDGIRGRAGAGMCWICWMVRQPCSSHRDEGAARCRRVFISCHLDERRCGLPASAQAVTAP